MKNIAVFISGTGSNAKKIIEYFNGSKTCAVKIILSSYPESPLLQYAREKKIAVKLLNKKTFRNSSTLIALLKRFDLVVLAGFLWLIPERIVSSLPNKIINIHPALLPKYGGRGMFGINVHKSIVKNKEKETGITIHYVNNHYDEGKIIFQKSCPVLSKETPEEVQIKVQILEHKYYPKIIESLLL